MINHVVAYMGKVRQVMNIDKAKLKLGIWYEDENGNVINQKEDLMWKTPEKARTYHSCFPLRITECIYAVHSKS